MEFYVAVGLAAVGFVAYSWAFAQRAILDIRRYRRMIARERKGLGHG